MIQRAIEQPGHGREADMRMRAHIDALAGRHHGRSQMVEEHERPDIPALWKGQDPPHAEPAQVANSRLDQEFHSIGHRFPFVRLQKSMDDVSEVGKLYGWQ